MRALHCDDVLVELAMLHEIADERRARWEAAGADREVVDGPPTVKPAAWLILSRGTGMGQLTVWISRGAEMEWGTPDITDTRHCDLGSREAMSACVAA